MMVYEMVERRCEVSTSLIWKLYPANSLKRLSMEEVSYVDDGNR